MRVPRDEALVRLDVEEEQHVADVGVPGAVPERGVLGGEHGRERAERERRVLPRDLQRLRERRGAHAPAAAGGGELLLELGEGLRQRALREDELGDGQEAVLERHPPRAEQRRGSGGGGGRRRRRWGRGRGRSRVRRRVEGLVGHRGDARGRGVGEGGDLGVRWERRGESRGRVTRRVRGFFFSLPFLKGSFGFLILVFESWRDGISSMRVVTEMERARRDVTRPPTSWPDYARGSYRARVRGPWMVDNVRAHGIGLVSILFDWLRFS